MSNDRLHAAAAKLDDAARTATAVSQLSESDTFGVDDAYEIQRISMQRRYERGERLVGIKLGFTSRAKMEQMGVDDMIWGRLTDQMAIENGGAISLDNYVHPRVEPEIAFLLKGGLTGDISIADAQAATQAVAPAMELIDSRYEDFRFNLADVVADNCSSSGFVVGDWREPLADLGNLHMTLEFDGETVQSGTSGAILGNPWQSLVDAARLAAGAGMELEPGWIIFAGAATAAEALRPGVHARTLVEDLGTAELTVGGSA